MSFTIELQHNNSDNNVLTKNITTLSTVSGVLKDKTSILRPVIVFEGALPTGCNYMHISDFNRYYYVDDVSSVNGSLYEVSAHVDVLQTYNSQIRACRGIVARQESNWNLYVDDGTFKTYQNDVMLLKKFPTGFSTNEFVLAVAGSSSS